MGRPSTGTKVAARSRISSIPLSTSESSTLRSSTSTSRSLYCPSSNSGRTSNVAELHRPGFREVDFVDLRLRHRDELAFGDGALDLLGDEGLQHFTLDVVSKT